MSYLKKSEKVLPVAQELNLLLADYHIYYQNLRNFHWNILGNNFFELHVKFEALYNDAHQKIDEIAERILTLRYHPMSNLSDYLEISTIKEVSPMSTDSEMVKKTLENHEILLNQMYEVVDKAGAISDEGTIDLMGSYIADLEKSSWMLEAWETKTSGQLKKALLEKTCS